MSDSARAVPNTDETLSKHFHRLVLELGITPTQWEELMDKYIATHHASADATVRDLIHLRANLTLNLLAPEMSWKTFVKGLKMLGQNDIILSSPLRAGARLYSEASLTK